MNYFPKVGIQASFVIALLDSAFALQYFRRPLKIENGRKNKKTKLNAAVDVFHIQIYQFCGRYYTRAAAIVKLYWSKLIM